MGKILLRFLFSLHTTLWSLVAIMLLFLAGAFVMPAREEFKTIHAKPMLEWLVDQQLDVTWWLWGSIGILALLTVNTLFCSIESLVKKGRRGHWLLVISPQIIHSGFIIMLAAHLISSLGGFHYYDVAAEGTVLRITDNTDMMLRDIHITLDSGGYVTDWAVSADILEGGTSVSQGRIMPNSPLFHRGTGIYVKDLRAYPRRMVLIEISREPGAYWALAGGILFMIGSLLLIALKMKREGQQEKAVR